MCDSSSQYTRELLIRKTTLYQVIEFPKVAPHPEGQLFKAFVLVAVAVAIIVIGTFLISAIQPEFKLDEVLFEVSSGFSTTGLSMGITKALNPANRIIMCVIMLLGRLGPLTVIGIVNKNWMTSSKEQIQYVEESVVIG